MAGGYVDLRFVATYRGSGRTIDNDRVQVTMGGTALIEAGGSFNAMG